MVLCCFCGRGEMASFRQQARAMFRPHFTKQSNDPANHNGSHAGNNGTGRQHPKRDHPNLALCLIVPPSIVGHKTKNGSRSSGTGVTAPYLAARPAA